MKKILYTIVLLTVVNVAAGQGFFKKIKSKVEKAVSQPAATVNPVPGGGNEVPGNKNFTDPAPYGTVIKTFSKKELEAHMGGSDGGFVLWFKDLKVANNQLQFKVADYDESVYNYTGGQLVLTGEKAGTKSNDIPDGNESEQYSKDFSQLDMANAMLKRGSHVSSGMVPGKATQTLTFKGKPLGDFMMYALAHNADSTAIAAAGVTISAGGVNYKLTTSTGQTVMLPKKYGYQVLVSPDGKLAAAADFGQGDGGLAYLSNGSTVKTGTAFNGIIWLRNSGSVFNVEQSNPKALYKNGALYHTFEQQVDPKIIFIGKDEKNMCWYGDHGLYFSDGTAFENGMSARKITIDNKELIVFLAVNVTSGKLYLCRHDL